MLGSFLGLLNGQREIDHPLLRGAPDDANVLAAYGKAEHWQGCVIASE